MRGRSLADGAGMKEIKTPDGGGIPSWSGTRTQGHRSPLEAARGVLRGGNTHGLPDTHGSGIEAARGRKLAAG